MATVPVQLTPDAPDVRRRRSAVAQWVTPANAGWTAGVVLLLIAGAVGVVLQAVPSLRHLYLQQNLLATFKAPGAAGHLLGTDNLGRDLGWQLLSGLGVSLSIGVGVSLLSVVLGLIVGIAGGFFGEVADATANIAVDVTWAFPAILLA